MRGEILGVERRRRWSDDQKLSIVASVGVDRATVAQIAQRHEVTRSQIYSWRRELKHKGLLPEDEPARFLSLPPVQAAPLQDCGVLRDNQGEIRIASATKVPEPSCRCLSQMFPIASRP